MTKKCQFTKPDPNLAIAANMMQTAIPMTVGIKNDAKVHLLLNDSFLIVRSVVPQGKWKRVKSITLTPVIQVHPLSISRFLNAVRLSSSSRLAFAV